MAIGVDRVRPTKVESTATGGDDADQNVYGSDTPIEPQEDAMETAGLFIQDEAARDEQVQIYRDGGVLYGVDTVNTSPVAFLQTAAGGLTADQHKDIRQLIHFIDEGPAEDFATLAYKETLPTANPFPTSVIWWESSSKVDKIVEKTITYNANKTPATIEWKMYDTDGSTLLVTVTDTISYSGVFETTRSRAII